MVGLGLVVEAQAGVVVVVRHCLICGSAPDAVFHTPAADSKGRKYTDSLLRGVVLFAPLLPPDPAAHFGPDSQEEAISFNGPLKGVNRRDFPKDDGLRPTMRHDGRPHIHVF